MLRRRPFSPDYVINISNVDAAEGNIVCEPSTMASEAVNRSYPLKTSQGMRLKN